MQRLSSGHVSKRARKFSASVGTKRVVDPNTLDVCISREKTVSMDPNETQPFTYSIRVTYNEDSNA